MEAIESNRDDWFAVGLQFQPELDYSTNLGQRIFEEFVEEARAGATAEPQYVSMTQCYHDLHHLDHC